MVAPLRTYRSLQTIICHSQRLGKSTLWQPADRRVLQPVRSFVSTPKIEDVPRRGSRFFQRALTFSRYSGYFLLSSVFGVLAIGTGIFIHDAFTYTDKHVDRVPINPLSLSPEKGGPNNLPVLNVLVDDDDDDEHRKLAKKPRLVIVGGGWGVSLVSYKSARTFDVKPLCRPLLS